MLIEHCPSHLNKGPILTLNNIILLGDIRRGKLMLKTQKSTKGFKMSILELCAIVTMNYNHGILGNSFCNRRMKSQVCEKASSLLSMKTPKSSEKNRPQSLECTTSHHLIEPELNQLCPCEVARWVPWS
jgi:hypothetical protein